MFKNIYRVIRNLSHKIFGSNSHLHINRRMYLKIPKMSLLNLEFYFFPSLFINDMD